MSELATALYDEEVLLGDDVPDAALELAGSKLWEGRPPLRPHFAQDWTAAQPPPRINTVYMSGAGYSRPLISLKRR
jgi:hypothetical protein